MMYYLYYLVMCIDLLFDNVRYLKM